MRNRFRGMAWASAVVCSCVPAMAQQLTLLGDSDRDTTGAVHELLASITVGGPKSAQGLLQTGAQVSKAVLFLYIDTVGVAGKEKERVVR
jgi:hypothetical protein